MKSVKLSELLLVKNNLSLSERFDVAYSKTEAGQKRIAAKKIIANCTKYACIGVGVVTAMYFIGGIQANATVEGIESLKASNPTLWGKFTKCVLDTGKVTDSFLDARGLLDYNLARIASTDEIESLRKACCGMTDQQVFAKIIEDIIQGFRTVASGL